MDVTEEKIVKPVVNQNPVNPVTPPVNNPSQSTKTPEEDKTDDVEELIPQEPYQTSPLFYEITNYFGIGENEYDVAKDEVSVIVDHAISETKSNQAEDILRFLKSIETKLGISPLTDKRYKHVYRYVRLTAKRSALDKAISAIERQEING